MRRKIVAGNWKMNLEWNEAQALFHSLLDVTSETAEVIVFPPSIYLSALANKLDNSALKLGAQNCHTEVKGAYTGEISATMIKSIGATHVLIGHSERREYNGETNEILKQKFATALAAGLTPILCCGEALAVREAEQQNDFVTKQLEAVLSGFDPEQLKDLVIAYEPIWAIGTGLTATSEQAEQMHAHIRTWLATFFNTTFAEQTPILYGGSCNEKNAAELFACPNVDGGLIGGASLKEDTFKQIIAAR